ncbi:MAG: ComEC/Rec2 family competence protein [Acidimicrobiia bacterium]
MRIPSRAGTWALAAAGAVWAGALLGMRFGLMAAVGLAIVAIAVALRWPAASVLIVLLVAGAMSGFFAASRIAATLESEIPSGPIEFVGVVAEDDGPRRPAVVGPEALRDSGGWVPWAGPAVGVGPNHGTPLVAGQRVRIVGTSRSIPGRIRGDPIAGRVTISDVEVLGTGGGPLFTIGNAVRDRVRSVLDISQRSEALVAGFLIGDTSGLGARDLDALRRSGLTHFVAVSGSNVALFLAAWWVLTAAVGIGPKRRFVLGVIGLGIFVVATRWEASVLRAAVMAATVLGAASTGIVVDTWVAIGVAVALLLVVSGQLAVDVGFQLSVAATIGIMVGSGMFANRRPKALWATLGAATAAQVAVVPVLLLHFGTVPLMSPIANLLSAPLVTAATVTGAIAVVVGWGPSVAVSSVLAGAVLGIADVTARWPQLGPAGVLAASGTAALIRLKRTRPPAVAGLAVVLAVSVLVPSRPPSVPMVTFLDVGQGDSVLLRDPSGRVVLVDGGSDPLLLGEALRRHHIGRVDLLVGTHGDVDHVGGFEGIFSDHSVGRLWVPDHPDQGPEMESLVEAASAAGVPIDRVQSGISYTLGSIEIGALGPRRRYAERNDGSVVLWVAGEQSVLLPGDIGAVAQRELPPLQPDILLVPHHGSSSTDPSWLASTVGSVAVISVGPNTYGHPTPEVLSVLSGAGTDVRVTMDEGDVSLELGAP